MIIHKVILFALLIDLWLIQSVLSLVTVEWNFAAKANSSAAVHLGSTLNLICQVTLSTPGKFDVLMLSTGESCLKNATTVATCNAGEVFFSYTRTVVPSGAYQNRPTTYAVYTSMDSSGTEYVYTVLTIPNVSAHDLTTFNCNYYSSADRVLVSSQFSLVQIKSDLESSRRYYAYKSNSSSRLKALSLLFLASQILIQMFYWLK